MVVSDLFCDWTESYGVTIQRSRLRPDDSWRWQPFYVGIYGLAVGNIYMALAHLDYSQEVLSALTLGFAAGAAILRAFVVPAWWYESAVVTCLRHLEA